MKSEEASIDVVGEIEVTASTRVLQNRTLYVDNVNAHFGEPIWDISAAIHDRHSAGQAMHWEQYPSALRHACKLYVFALINVVEDAPRLAYARSKYPHIKTIWSDQAPLRAFMRWLDQQGIRSFDRVCMDDLERTSTTSPTKRESPPTASARPC